MTTDFFGFGKEWKSTRIFICKTESLSLWLAIHKVNTNAMVEDRHMTREEYKEALSSFPYEVSDCRCKDCRYLRLIRKAR